VNLSPWCGSIGGNPGDRQISQICYSGRDVAQRARLSAARDVGELTQEDARRSFEIWSSTRIRWTSACRGRLPIRWFVIETTPMSEAERVSLAARVNGSKEFLAEPVPDACSVWVSRHGHGARKHSRELTRAGDVLRSSDHPRRLPEPGLVRPGSSPSARRHRHRRGQRSGKDPLQAFDSTLGSDEEIELSADPKYAEAIRSTATSESGFEARREEFDAGANPLEAEGDGAENSFSVHSRMQMRWSAHRRETPRSCAFRSRGTSAALTDVTSRDRQGAIEQARSLTVAARSDGDTGCGKRGGTRKNGGDTIPAMK